MPRHDEGGLGHRLGRQLQLFKPAREVMLGMLNSSNHNDIRHTNTEDSCTIHAVQRRTI